VGHSAVPLFTQLTQRKATVQAGITALRFEDALLGLNKQPRKT
jgi:hypothetical protein